MTRRIIQFGTSRFLQAHADLFVHDARAQGQDIGPITVVKTAPGRDRAGRVQHFGRPEGYPVIIRGYSKGQLVDHSRQITSVDSALIATDDWPALTAQFAGQAEVVFSNVGDSGYEIPAADRSLIYAAPGIPASFPGKLLALLIARFAAGGQPILILPCELIAHNGQVLRRLLTDLAQEWHAPPAFLDWFIAKVAICDTLVDRIVSAEIDPIGAVAEPYGLWAIAPPPGIKLPFWHPNIIVTDDLEPYLRLKLHILNLGHTYLAELWQQGRRRADETVRDILADPAIRTQLIELYTTEIIPGFAVHAMQTAARAYVTETLERFDNPFLQHYLREIAQNHEIKIARRMNAFMKWVQDREPTMTLPKLTAITEARR